jgi:hypothetical protein
VVVTGEAGDYNAFINIANEYYAVNFIDDRRRVYLTYGFEDVGDGSVFLNDVGHLEYRDGDEPYEIMSYFFKQSGKVALQRAASNSTKATIQEGTCDVSANWDTRPKFGEYENLLERITDLKRLLDERHPRNDSSIA